MVRRIYLYFDKLTFSEVSQLRLNYGQYYAAGADVVREVLAGGGEDNGAGAGVDDDMVMDDSTGDTRSADEYRLPSALPSEFQESGTDGGEGGDVGRVSRKQADLFIAQQANLLQTGENSAMAPAELQQQVQRILRPNPDLTEAHYLSFLNCLRVREVIGATDSLYASFNQAVMEV